MKTRQPALMTTADYRRRLDQNMPEADFQAQVLELAEKLGWTHRYHTHDSRGSASGFPDLVLVHPKLHLTIFVELKSGRGTVRDDQWDWHHTLKAGNSFAYIWRPTEWPEIERVLGGQV